MTYKKYCDSFKLKCDVYTKINHRDILTKAGIEYSSRGDWHWFSMIVTFDSKEDMNLAMLLIPDFFREYDGS